MRADRVQNIIHSSCELICCLLQRYECTFILSVLRFDVVTNAILHVFVFKAWMSKAWM